jgi:hypothetical protein
VGSAEDLAKYSAEALRKLAKSAGLDVKGGKDALVRALSDVHAQLR